VSPWRAPFGSFEFGRNFSEKALTEFVHYIDNFVRERKLTDLRITSWPNCYCTWEQSVMLNKVLLENGFKIAVKDHNYHLETGAPFESFIHVSERGKLNKCKKAGFRFALGTPDDIVSVHSLISEARERRGYPLSMTRQDYEKMFLQFSDRYILFTLFDQEKLIAAGTGVKVNSKIIYNFLGANDYSYKSYSPMVMLVQGAYEYCMNHGYQIFDLGTTSVNGIINPGLTQFKKYLGGRFSNKVTYQKFY
jgi:hypothetical protein